MYDPRCRRPNVWVLHSNCHPSGVTTFFPVAVVLASVDACAAMDIPIHNQILWRACEVAAKRLSGRSAIGDPRAFYPLLVRGSWMNDTNQATLFTETVAPNTGSIEQKRFFRNLWVAEQSNVLEDLQRGATDIVDAARRVTEGADHADDFSKYQPLDHLDVVNEDVDREHDRFGEHRGAAKTVRDTMTFYVPDKLMMSTVKKSAADRTSVFRLTELGRALHTVADFYSHSNYIELLLWQAAWRKELSAEVVSAFEEPPAPFEDDHEMARPRLTLPIGASALPVRDAFMWYGGSPAETPLVSALFTPDDTAHSLLEMYATHLENATGKVSADDLDLVLSVLQVPGRPIVKAVFELYQDASDFLTEIGRKARSFLVRSLAGAVERANPKARETLEPVVKLMEHYDSERAAEWAKAGRYRYLVHVLNTELAKKYADQDVYSPRLPHHSLIAKDHADAHESDATRRRHNMACALAVEATAAILEWHFAADEPTLDRYAALSQHCFVHPVHQLEQGKVISGAEVDALARRISLNKWHQLNYDVELLRWHA